MSTRLAYFIGLVVICALLAVSIYLQVVDGIMPCPLCSLQRLTFVLLGVVFLLGLAMYRLRVARGAVNVLAIVISIAGIFLAGRQVWLQHYPPADSAECGVSLQYMMQVLPWQEVAQKIFTGTAECTQRGWEFLSLNMAEWALIFFAFFTVWSVYLFVKRT